MSLEIGRIVLVSSWDGKTRPALLVDRKGGDWVTVPFTTNPESRGAVYVGDWRANSLNHESWLFHFLQRAKPSDVTDIPDGPAWVTRSCAESVVKLFGHQISEAGKRAVLDAHKNKEKAA